MQSKRKYSTNHVLMSTVFHINLVTSKQPMLVFSCGINVDFPLNLTFNRN